MKFSPQQLEEDTKCNVTQTLTPCQQRNKDKLIHLLGDHSSPCVCYLYIGDTLALYLQKDCTEKMFWVCSVTFPVQPVFALAVQEQLVVDIRQQELDTPALNTQFVFHQHNRTTVVASLWTRDHTNFITEGADSWKWRFTLLFNWFCSTGNSLTCSLVFWSQ